MSAAAALKVIEIMERVDYPGKALAIAEKVNARAAEWVEKFDVVGNVRGTGAMMGIEFVTDKASKTPNAALVSAIVQYAMNKGLMLEAAGTYGNVIRFLCPLCVTDEQLAVGLDIFEEAIEACK
jgi:4-aminobutyrate aminotransferase/(S)-3-amino-2-methylpropionate transaminase